MKLLAAIVLGAAVLWTLACVGVVLFAVFRPRPERARRWKGLCAVPGCGKSAGHWKAAAKSTAKGTP